MLKSSSEGRNNRSASKLEPALALGEGRSKRIVFGDLHALPAKPSGALQVLCHLWAFQQQ